MARQIMVDLETMGTQPGAAIVSIGAVAFDPIVGVPEIDTFYEVVDLESCVTFGLRLEPRTVMWWLGQGDEARRALTAAAQPLNHVLARFRQWCLASGEVAALWGHGANFDEPLLTAAFRATQVAVPWDFWSARCTRTVFDLAGVRPNRARGVHHNALDDARAQAVAVCEAYRKLGLTA